jgi:RNA polymerase subunit RPABC4/transcription elongation factor Spt4
MALIKCRECTENISEDARVCPKCGSKQFNITSIFESLFWG